MQDRLGDGAQSDDAAAEGTAGAAGGARSTLSRLLQLPFRYFNLKSQPHVGALFPSLLVIVDGHAGNRALARADLSEKAVSDYVARNQERLDALMDAEGPGGELGRAPGAGSASAASAASALPFALRLEARFPPARWPAVVAFFRARD
jgi:hypothetical protein